MNYIKRLQEENEELRRKSFAVEQAALELMNYAKSDKFMGESGVGGPTYINKNDVIHRVEVILREIPKIIETDEEVVRRLRANGIDERSILGEDERMAAQHKRDEEGILVVS
jgi:hypothetical protein